MRIVTEVPSKFTLDEQLGLIAQTIRETHTLAISCKLHYLYARLSGQIKPDERGKRRGKYGPRKPKRDDAEALRLVKERANQQESV